MIVIPAQLYRIAVYRYLLVRISIKGGACHAERVVVPRGLDDSFDPDGALTRYIVAYYGLIGKLTRKLALVDPASGLCVSATVYAKGCFDGCPRRELPGFRGIYTDIIDGLRWYQELGWDKVALQRTYRKEVVHGVSI